MLARLAIFSHPSTLALTRSGKSCDDGSVYFSKGCDVKFSCPVHSLAALGELFMLGSNLRFATHCIQPIKTYNDMPALIGQSAGLRMMHDAKTKWSRVHIPSRVYPTTA